MTDLLYYEEIYRLALAVLIGAVLGIPHVGYVKNAPRIYALACLAGSLVMLVSTWGFSGLSSLTVLDPARLSAQVITGMGFLGAGIISIHQGRVYGLPTAAGLWLTASIGLVLGMGWYLMASVAFLISLGALFTYPLPKKLVLPKRTRTKEAKIKNKEIV